ncbi:MAG TPA: NAD(P)H-binding protein [Immundisolibacter sp.]|nr:NAD(P)H-binding protein [Immundisolibacter sp.]
MDGRQIPRTVLIAGCGDLGSRLARLLLDQGRHVIGLRRQARALPQRVQAVAADLAVGVPRLPRVDQVVFCAAPDSGDAAAYRAVYETAWGNLLAAVCAAETPPQRLLLITSTRPYAQQDGGWVDEDSPVSAHDAQTASLLRAESMLRDSGLPGLVLRPAGLYGAGEGPLLRSLREGRARCAAGPPRWSNRMHRDDAARAIAHLLGLADPAPLYLGVDCEPTDHAALLRELAAWIGVPAPGSAQLPPPAANRRCRNARLLASGFRFMYPSWREGYGAVLG